VIGTGYSTGHDRVESGMVGYFAESIVDPEDSMARA
jgi:hypothetical protein